MSRMRPNANNRGANTTIVRDFDRELLVAGLRQRVDWHRMDHMTLQQSTLTFGGVAVYVDAYVRSIGGTLVVICTPPKS